MRSSFYSNGKLLLTGEYAVLDGALSLALPCRFGQELKVRQTSSGILQWISYDEQHSIWFRQNFDLNRLEALGDQKQSEEEWSIGQQLQKILKSTRELNPGFLSAKEGYEVDTYLEFHRNWGLGTSSTLINNIAQWAEVDPYILNKETFGGSGYDIACANHNQPILYQLIDQQAVVTEINFSPAFIEQLFFVYLNIKQDSRKGIENFRNKEIDKSGLINEISALTKEFVQCELFSDFQDLIRQHELLLSQALELPTIQDALFPDYPGAIKSLGAWGGDFILAAGPVESKAYFEEQGYPTVLPYSNMVLEPDED